MNTRQNVEEDIYVRRRYYTEEEILRAYKKFLIKHHKGYSEMREKELGLVRFIKYAKGHNKSLYTVDEDFIEKWKSDLLYSDKHYTPYYQIKILSRVKNFYDWFKKERYRKDNPMQNFIATEHKNFIKELCSSNSKRKYFEDLLPEYREMFDNASVYETSLMMGKKTIECHRVGWNFFLQYLQKNKIYDIKEVNEIIIEKYLLYLTECRNKEGQLFSLHKRCRYIIALKRLFGYLSRFRHIDKDPALLVELPKNPRGLPTAGIKEREVELILSQPDIETPLGVRDRAILETLYSTGIRNQELRLLKVDDIQFDSGMIRVNNPKGGIQYQRVIPIGKEALFWIAKYVNKVRTRLCKNKHEETLFLNYLGNHLSQSAVLKIVKTARTKAGLRNDKIVTHSFRVSCATGMLKGRRGNLKGADIKWVQEQLGHTSIQSTTQYLRLVPEELKRIHEQHHPREKIRKKSLRNTTEKILI